MTLMVAMVTDNGCQNRENDIVHKGTYELLAQLSLKWGKSGVGFTMIKNDVFYKIFPCKCSLSLIFFHSKFMQKSSGNFLIFFNS